MANDLTKQLICTNQGGYVALISAIVISILLVGITVTLSFTGFYSRFNVLDGEYKKVSGGLAEACVNVARLKIANDPAYTNSTAEEITLETGKACTIVSVAGTNPKTIRAQAIYQKAYTNIEAEVNPAGNDVEITSWKECPTFSTCP